MLPEKIVGNKYKPNNSEKKPRRVNNSTIYGNYIPEDMLSIFEKFSESNQSDFREESALIDTRTAKILNALEDDVGSIDWKVINAAVHNLEVAKESQQRGLYFRAIAELVVVLKRGSAQHAAWNEIRDNIQLKKNLIESQLKSAFLKNNYVEVAQVRQLLQKIQEGIKISLQEILDEEEYEVAINKITDFMKKMS